ncbi:HB2L protein, partial [Alaudala cheleensis]|nr:HB2L protein [Alaudala cheleensis]
APDRGSAHSGWFQYMVKYECHFLNDTEKVRYVPKVIYNREQFLHFDSDVGHFVGDTPFGEKVARNWNSDPAQLDLARAEVDTVCRHNYKAFSPFSVER